MTDRSPAATPWLGLGAIVLLAIVLRVPTLGSQSLWFDEAATWELMRLPFGEMLQALPDRESNPPLFYVLEWLVTRALGDGEFALRALSALAGTLTVPVAFAIGRRVGGVRAGLATALLVAVNPLLVWFSQEARSYELVAFLGACSLLLFLRALDDERPRVLAWWAVVSALALCSHYFAVFLLAPQALWLLWRHPRRPAVVGACAGLAVAGLALLPILLQQRRNPYDIAGGELGVRLLQVPKQFLLGYRGPLALLTGLLGAALIAGALWLLLRRADRRTRERALLVGGLGLLGVVVPSAAAVVGVDYLNARNLIPALVPLAAALGAGFGVATSRRDARLGTGLLTTLSVVSVAVVIAVATTQEYQRPDWKGLAAALGETPADRAIVISPANGETALRYYRRELEPLPQEGAPLRDVEVVTVAGSTGPGEPPVLPRQVGTQYPLGTWQEPDREGTASWVILHYRQVEPQPIPPGILAFVRFGDRPPSVALLPGSQASSIPSSR